MSDQQAALYAAFIEAQAKFPVIPKNRTADTGKYKYKYADINDIIAAVVPILSQGGLAFSQAMHDGCLVTSIMHKDGGVMSDGGMPVPMNSDPQKMGSALTYMRRYALAAMLGIASDQDIDGLGGESEAPPAPKLGSPAYTRIVNAIWAAAGIGSFNDKQRWNEILDLTPSFAAQGLEDVRGAAEALKESPDREKCSELERKAITQLLKQLTAELVKISERNEAA